MSYRQGDVVLVEYPYTDSSTRKFRPAIIVYCATGELYWVVKVTTVTRIDQWSFPLDGHCTPALQRSPSEARANEIATIHQKVINRKVSELNSNALADLLERLKNNLRIC